MKKLTGIMFFPKLLTGSFFNYLFLYTTCICVALVDSCAPNKPHGFGRYIEDYYLSYKELCSNTEAKPANMIVVSFFNKTIDSLEFEIVSSNALMDTTLFSYDDTHFKDDYEIDYDLLGLNNKSSHENTIISVAITEQEESLKFWGYYFWNCIPILIYSEKNVDLSTIICPEQLTRCLKTLRDYYVSNDIHYCYLKKHYCMEIQ